MSFWNGRRVFVTGHTGFKGSWLATRLCALGANVTAYALPPETHPSAYQLLRIGSRVREHLADITDARRLAEAVAKAQPEFVFHLAASALVRRSYREPLKTVATNVLGTAALLDAVRAVPTVAAVVVVTSDKTYANREPRRMREEDALGGDDPYSASKACAEILTASYRSTFFRDGPAVATARAGNVIGGGDWSEDRLIPDLVRAATSGAAATLRYPGAIRPWQHVADVVNAYLLLAERLSADSSLGRAWNFGPAAPSSITVLELARRFLALYAPACSLHVEAAGIPEKQYLSLDSSRARSILDWTPAYELEDGISATAGWYSAWREGRDLVELTCAQLQAAPKAVTRP